MSDQPASTDDKQNDVIAQLKAKAEAKKKENEETAEHSGFTPAKKTPSKKIKPVFALKVYSPYKVYYEEDAESISGLNDTGPFDILPGHKNFLTLLKEGSITVRNYRGEESFNIVRGVLHVKDDEVVVFLDV